MRPKIVAHRGASGIVGEDNTLVSFQRAIQMGADIIELDVRRTADGQIVCFHDKGIGAEAVSELSREGLSRAAGVQVPTLKEAAELCAGKIGLLVELKEPGYDEEVAGVLAGTMGTNEFSLQSFHANAVSAASKAASGAKCGLLVGRDAQAPDGAAVEAMASRCGADFVAVHHELLDAGFIRDVGLPVYVWTVDVPGRMAEFASLPLAGIITNRPDYLREVLAAPPRRKTACEIKAAAADGDAQGTMASVSGTIVDGIDVATRHCRIGREMIGETAEWAASLWGSGAKIAVVMDASTRAAAGERVLGMLPRAAAVELEPLPGWGHLTPHDSLAGRVIDAACECDALVAVGAGTVNDITKYAADRAGKPYMAIATAPSMNGYTSSIAALLIDGLKVTTPCTPPAVVIGDTDILADAPRDLIRSGYADLLSKPVATADWRLASIVLGESFTDLPGSVTESAVARCVDSAEGIGKGDPESVQGLMEALVLSGYGMVLAGSSSPASGGEHLISHLLDMLAYSEGRSPQRHGLQVGVGTLLASKLYEMLREVDPAGLVPRSVEPVELEAVHGELWPAIREQALGQLLAPAEGVARVELIRSLWDEIWSELDSMLVPAGEMRSRLVRAGVPVSPDDLGIPFDRVRHSLLHCADIRNRYTVLHFARDTGILPRRVDDVLSVLGSW